MKFYRGMNLSCSEVDYIYQNGDMNAGLGQWLSKPTINHHNMSVDKILDVIHKEPDDIQRYIMNSDNLLDAGRYVTGCFEGASIYSNDGDEKAKNVVIVINANLQDVFIDGRDFLYAIFFRLIKSRLSLDKSSLNKLAIIFGEKILEYIDKGKELIDRKINIINRYIDYICMDKIIIESHYNNNKVLIQGRYSTKFFSAFAIIGGISPIMIEEIKDSKNINRKTPVNMIRKDVDTINIYDL